jgi:L-threonylcarbamoyladenylate synthase
MTSSNDISRGVQRLAAGELVAFPTETVYGLGADACNDLAVAKVYETKGRPSFNPLISHVASIEAAMAQGQFSAEAIRLAETFWPGPLTLVVPRSESCNVSLLASAGLPSLALRVPDHPVALALLRAFGRPVVAPSANPSGGISPTLAQHVRSGLPDTFVIDGGACVVGLESTVVGFVDGEIRLMRPGGIESATIEGVLGHRLSSSTEHGGTLHSPGQMESHYAPRAALRLNAYQPADGETYLGFGDHLHGAHTLSRSGSLVEAAAHLFRKLHEIDNSGAAVIAVAPIPMDGLGEAINDRLRRAAAPRPQ